MDLPTNSLEYQIRTIGHNINVHIASMLFYVVVFGTLKIHSECILNKMDKCRRLKGNSDFDLREPIFAHFCVAKS